MSSYRINDSRINTIRISGSITRTEVDLGDIDDISVLSTLSGDLDVYRGVFLEARISAITSLITDTFISKTAFLATNISSTSSCGVDRFTYKHDASTSIEEHCYFPYLIADRITYFDNLDAVNESTTLTSQVVRRIDVGSTMPSILDFYVNTSGMLIRSSSAKITTASYMAGSEFDLIYNLMSTSPLHITAKSSAYGNGNYWRGDGFALRIGKGVLADATEGRIKIPYNPYL